jgi:hypothetical protein
MQTDARVAAAVVARTRVLCAVFLVLLARTVVDAVTAQVDRQAVVVA